MKRFFSPIDKKRPTGDIEGNDPKKSKPSHSSSGPPSSPPSPLRSPLYAAPSSNPSTSPATALGASIPGDGKPPRISFTRYATENAGTAILRVARRFLSNLNSADQGLLVRLIAASTAAVDLQSILQPHFHGYNRLISSNTTTNAIHNSSSSTSPLPSNLIPRPASGPLYIDAVYRELCKALHTAGITEFREARTVPMLKTLIELVLPLSSSSLKTDLPDITLIVILTSPGRLGSDPMETRTSKKLQSVVNSARAIDLELRLIAPELAPSQKFPTNVVVSDCTGVNFGDVGTYSLQRSSSSSTSSSTSILSVGTVMAGGEIAIENDIDEDVSPASQQVLEKVSLLIDSFDSTEIATDVDADGVLPSSTLFHPTPSSSSSSSLLSPPTSGSSHGLASSSLNNSDEKFEKINSNTGKEHSDAMDAAGNKAIAQLGSSCVESHRVNNPNAKIVPFSNRFRDANFNLNSPGGFFGKSSCIHPSAMNRFRGQTSKAINALLLTLWPRCDLTNAFKILGGKGEDAISDLIERVGWRVRKARNDDLSSVSRDGTLHQIRMQLTSAVAEFLASNRQLKHPSPNDMTHILSTVWRNAQLPGTPSEAAKAEALSVFCTGTGSRYARDIINCQAGLTDANPIQCILHPICLMMGPFLRADNSTDNRLPTVLPEEMRQRIILEVYESLRRTLPPGTEDLNPVYLADAVRYFGTHGAGLTQARHRGGGEPSKIFEGLLKHIPDGLASMRKKVAVKRWGTAEKDQLYEVAKQVLVKNGKSEVEMTEEVKSYLFNWATLGDGKRSIGNKCTRVIL